MSLRTEVYDQGDQGIAVFGVVAARIWEGSEGSTPHAAHAVPILRPVPVEMAEGVEEAGRQQATQALVGQLYASTGLLWSEAYVREQAEWRVEWVADGTLLPRMQQWLAGARRQSIHKPARELTAADIRQIVREVGGKPAREREKGDGGARGDQGGG